MSLSLNRPIARLSWEQIRIIASLSSNVALGFAHVHCKRLIPGPQLRTLDSELAVPACTISNKRSVGPVILIGVYVTLVSEHSQCKHSALVFCSRKRSTFKAAYTCASSQGSDITVDLFCAHFSLHPSLLSSSILLHTLPRTTATATHLLSSRCLFLVLLGLQTSPSS